MSKTFKTKTARILDLIIQAMEIHDCEVKEKFMVHTVGIMIEPEWKEDYLLLVGEKGGTFKTLRNLCRFIADKEGLVLVMDRIVEPEGDVRQRESAFAPDVEDLKALAFEIGCALFGACQVKVETLGDLFEITVTTEASAKILERLLQDTFMVIGKSRGVQIGITVQSESIVTETNGQPKTSAGRFTKEVKR